MKDQAKIDKVIKEIKALSLSKSGKPNKNAVWNILKRNNSMWHWAGNEDSIETSQEIQAFINNLFSN